MLSTPHTLTGIAIVATVANPILGIGLAIGSHFILDFINESGLSRKDQTHYDMNFSIMGYLISILLFIIDSRDPGYLFLESRSYYFILGSICGNLLDLIDKKLYLAIFFPERYKPTYYFHLRKKPLLNPPPIITKVIGVVSFLLILLFFYYS